MKRNSVTDCSHFIEACIL